MALDISNFERSIEDQPLHELEKMQAVIDAELRFRDTLYSLKRYRMFHGDD